jgi:DNA-binding transcriptional MerR regulator
MRTHPRPRRVATAGWYTSADVCVLAGCTYRQLDTWCRSGWVTPSVTEASGHGSKRRWSPGDVGRVQRLRVASELADTPLFELAERLEELGVA